MRAVVLLGGAGTRLRPLTLDRPKQALPVAEVPMISRVLAHLEDHGVTEAVLSLGYLSQAFLDLFPEGRAGGVRLRYAVEPEPLDTGGAIAFAARTAGIDEPFLVANGDVLTDLDIGAMVAFHRSAGAEATIALAHVPDSSAFGLVHRMPDGRVTDFLEKPPRKVAGPGDVNAGTYVFEASVVDRIAPGGRVSVERQVFPGLVSDGRLFAFPSRDYWTDTGTPLQYLQAQLDLIAGRRPGPPAPGARDRGDGVWSLDGAVVDGDVTGPALLGPAAFVAPGAAVSASVVGAGARVQEGAVVAESVLLPAAVVRPGARVHRSIVGQSCVVGEQARLTDAVVGGAAEIEPGRVVDGERVPPA